MFGSLGLPELLIIVFIVVILFGSRTSPEVFKGVGEGIKSFKDAMHGEEKDPEKKDPPK